MKIVWTKIIKLILLTVSRKQTKFRSWNGFWGRRRKTKGLEVELLFNDDLEYKDLLVCFKKKTVISNKKASLAGFASPKPGAKPTSSVTCSPATKAALSTYSANISESDNVK